MDQSKIERNKELVRRFVDGLNQRKLDVFDELLAADFVDRTPAPGVPPTREGWKSTFPMAAFPDLQIHVEDLIAAEDRVVVRSNVVGTHRDEFMSVPATGQEVSALNITIFAIDDGKIVEKWTLFDALGMLGQVGAIPAA